MGSFQVRIPLKEAEPWFLGLVLTGWRVCVCHSLRPKAFFQSAGGQRGRCWSLSNEATTPILGKRTCEVFLVIHTSVHWLARLGTMSRYNLYLHLLLTGSFSQCVCVCACVCVCVCVAGRYWAALFEVHFDPRLGSLWASLGTILRCRFDSRTIVKTAFWGRCNGNPGSEKEGCFTSRLSPHDSWWLARLTCGQLLGCPREAAASGARQGGWLAVWGWT